MTSRLHFATLVAGLAFVISGCFSPNNIVIVDQASGDGLPTIKSIKADGDILRVSIAQDSAPAWVAGVKATVIRGDVYLDTFHISSPISATEFEVDMSHTKFPRDWRNKLYWIESDAITSPINPFIVHRREIGRSKVVLEQ